MAFDPSHLDTSVGALIRSGAALLGIVLGGFVLAAKPRTRFARLYGLVLVLDGVGYSVFTLSGGYAAFPHKELVVPAHLVFVTIVFVTSALLTAAFWPELRLLRGQRLRFASGLVAAAPAATLAPIGFAFEGAPSRQVYGSDLGVALGMADAVGYGLYLAALTLIGAALLARVRGRPTNPRSRAYLLVGAAAVSNVVIQVGNHVADAAADGVSWVAVTILLAFALAILQLAFALLGLQSVGGWSRWVPIGLLLACLATAPIEAWTEIHATRDVGFGGIVSLVGLVGIGYAIFRLDLLGVQVPRPRAGFLAAVGLAALFATAQVAQNFLSDGLGLLWGGVVAGIVVFAAGPVQRRMERSAHAPGPAVAEKYRRLVETAWTDGQLGANERLLLAESRRQLGLDAETAAGIDEEVARGHVGPARPGRASRKGSTGSHPERL